MACYRETELIVADNTGAKLAQIIGAVGRSSGKKAFTVGDEIKVTIKQSTPGASVPKGKVIRAIITSTIAPSRRADGSVIQFGLNTCVLLKDDGSPVGTRVLYAVSAELRSKNKKIISLAPEVL